MIESIRLQNFQCYEDVTVPFHGGATVLVGESDIGKSAIIRALGWVLSNVPSGDFTRNGQKECQVTVQVDGVRITKTRRGSSTTYRIDDGDPFKGVEPPEAVKELVNTARVSWQFQMDSPFWLGDNGGEVSRKINETVDLRLIDSCAARVSVDSRQAVAEANAARKALEDAEKALEQLPDCEGPLALAERLLVREDAVAEAEERLEAFDKAANGLEELFQRSRDLDGAAECLSSVVEAAERLREAETALSRFISARESVEKLRVSLVSLEDLKDAEERVDLLQKRMDAVATRERGLRLFLDTVEKHDRAESALKKISETIESLQEQFDSRGVCPECGREIDG